MRGFALVWLIALAGCGDSVTVRSSGGTEPDPSGGGGPDPSTGPGGTTTTDPQGAVCGPGQPPCPSSAYCDTGGSCGAGVCVPRPRGCDDDCPGVCGCDGTDYCNACEAQSHGTDARPCDPGQYLAQAWPGGLDHIVIMRRDAAADTCVRIRVDAPTSGTFEVTAPDPWAVTGISAWASAGDCFDFATTPPGIGYTPISATGSVSWRLGSATLYPCALDVDISADYGAPTPWGPTSEAWYAQDVAVQGGCF